ncbi:hypothetical protein INT43_002088 [Umbelopsis isabellina]|uniref:Probable endonuclease LCL3 n=1 Tax=Mortierella isabellina TaxID=91625 RepID=A0A8H7PS78_MORIS|nr:hypothetical protein INT43_002088 [Umbelopsis isabellina]
MRSDDDQPWWKTLFGQEEQKTTNVIEKTLQAIPQEMHDAPIGWSVAAAAIGIPASIGLFRLIVGKRYPTAAHIPPQVFQKQKKIKGKVVSVGDSDNFRVYHTPGIGWGWLRHVPTAKKDLKDQTIHIRLAGVDAPEGAHFGMPAQPYSAESKDFLSKMSLNKKVHLELYSRDRYERVVAMAHLRRWPFYWIRRNVSMEMLKAGMASIYTAKGAEYGDSLEKLKKAEARAKLLRRGIWSQKDYVDPSEHKKQYLRGGDSPQ